MAQNTPNMGLRQWNLANDFFDYAQLSANWDKVDQHDHSSGKGVQIPTGGIANLAVTGPKLAADAVDASKILDGSVGSAELAANAVTTPAIADGSVATAKLADGSVTTVKIGNNQVTAAKIEAQQAWQTLTLSAGPWAAAGQNVRYYKDSLGLVHFRGQATVNVTGGTITAGTTIATMPVGYRPYEAMADTSLYPVGYVHNGNTGSPLPIIFNYNGNVYPQKDWVLAANAVLNFGSVVAYRQDT